MALARFVDPFDIALSDQRPSVLFGDVQVRNALRGGNIRSALDQAPEADLVLDPRQLPADIPDYLAPLVLQSGRGAERELFRGQVSRADPLDGEIEITARGANALTEQLAGRFTASALEVHEIAYTMARSAGLTRDQISIPELDERPVEVFEVLAPVDGVSSSTPRVVGSVLFLPAEQGNRHVATFDLVDDPEAGQPSAWAVTYVTNRFGYDAEQAGLMTIDRCLAWLTVRGRYGLALFPDGSPQRFSRQHGRALPRRLGVVVIYGQLTGRRWIRSSDMEAVAAHFELDADDSLLPLGAGLLPLVQRGAISACARAAVHGEPLTRLNALWEAVEYLVSGVRVPQVFNKADIRRVREALPDDLPGHLVGRLKQLLDDINATPLMARLRTLIEDLGLPCTDAELDLLVALRRTRNNATHGREPTPPSPEDLDRATAIVSRLVVARLDAGWR